MTFDTIYIGGGTPSLLSNNISRLINGLKINFNLINLSEATIEANPDSVSIDFIASAVDSGFTRISIGVQSLFDNELQSVNRIHSSTQAINAIKLAKENGFKKISVDVIIGLPGQTVSSLKKSIDTLIRLEIDHISVYCLSLEKGTLLSNHIPENLPSEDEQAVFYELVREMIISKGFIQYEISNFAKRGCECFHNINYWHGGEYIGLGPAAASHYNGKRFRNRNDLFDYINNPIDQIEEVEQLDLKRKITEEVILRLRLLEEGMNIKILEERYGKKNVCGVKNKIDKLVNLDLLTFDGVSYKLPKNKVLVSNPIFSEILED